MPKQRYTSTTYALARALNLHAGLTEAQIAEVLNITRGAVHQLLTHEVKTKLRCDFDPVIVEIAAATFRDARAAARKTFAAALRDAADRIEKEIEN